MYRRFLLGLGVALLAVAFSHSSSGDVWTLGNLFTLKAQQPPIAAEELRPAAPVVETVEPVQEEASFRYSQIILPTAAKYGMDWRLVAAVISVESGFNARATSSKGAMGLMQVMPGTAAIYKVKRVDLYDPQKNVDVGVQHLKTLHDRYSGDLRLVLAAYNSGELAVNRFHGVPPYRATQSFVRRVMQRYNSPMVAMGGSVGTKVR